ncbi:MAG: class I SAM-dependent methyltransferase [Arcobacter sp.]|uniref:class I SAM-dependent methyltransferase n=1 Tax=Arcobacter sp. TaxID=1872629 RepID=UPI003B00A2D3
MKKFTNENMIDIIEYLTNYLKDKEEKFICELEVLNPDISFNSYSGEKFNIDGVEHIYRSINSWNSLAQTLFCKLMTPKVISKNFIKLSFMKLNKNNSFHKSTNKQNEKYGVDSTFNNIKKNEEASFIDYYLNALKNVDISSKKRVLNLGVNSGDEFEVIKQISPNYKETEFVGIDFCESAINLAKRNLPESNFSFLVDDINNINNLDLGKFDLIISIGTLQSTTLNFKTFFMSLVQDYLEDKGAIILGFPNCRWIDTQMIYGAKAPNYSYSELSILFNDVIFCKKYLQQKKYRVTITGRDYIFLTATSIKKELV